MSGALVLGFPEYAGPAQALAAALDLPFQEVALHRFPDGESLVRLPQPLARHVVMCRSLNQPNDKLIELLLAARTARDLGTERITLVAPYLAYMRQDTAFNAGEAVSQRLIGAFLAELVDALICVDPHLHRVPDLAQVLPGRHAVALSSAATMGGFLRERHIEALLLGPDLESRQWVSTLAEAAGLSYAIASKVRGGDRSVTVTLPEQDFSGRDVVIVDDVISTGVTVAEAARLLRAAGARSVRCLVTHALFAPGAEERLTKSGIEAIWSSDSIVHPSNVVALADCLSDAVRAQLSR